MLKTRFSSEWIFKIFSHSFLLILVIFLPLCSSATWPRTRSFVTVTWSGWRITCAPTLLRPAELAAPALAALQTNVLDKSRARSSAALVGWCPSLHPAACLFEVSSSFFYLTVQTGFVVSVPPCWLHWEWLLSLFFLLSINSDHSWKGFIQTVFVPIWCPTFILHTAKYLIGKDLKLCF